MVHLLESYFENRTKLVSPTPVARADPLDKNEVTQRYGHEMPLGHSHAEPPWPFMVRKAAQKKPDGKRKASQSQTIHISMIDLELGLLSLTDNHIEVLYKLYMFQTYSLEELAKEQGVPLPLMRTRCHYALKTLTKHMNTLERNLR